MDILEEPQVVARILTARLSAEHPVWVNGCHFDYVGTTSDVPQTPDDVSLRPSSHSSGETADYEPFSPARASVHSTGPRGVNLATANGCRTFAIDPQSENAPSAAVQSPSSHAFTRCGEPTK